MSALESDGFQGSLAFPSNALCPNEPLWIAMSWVLLYKVQSAKRLRWDLSCKETYYQSRSLAFESQILFTHTKQ